MKYRLTQDFDDHWYIIPAEMDEAWEAFLDDPEMPYLKLPEWATQVDGPHVVTFNAYSVKI